MSQEILLHPNYCEDGQSLECFFELAAELHASGVEVRRKRADWPDADRYLEELARLKEKYKISKIVVGGPPINLVSSSIGVRRRELDEAMRFYRKAKTLLGVNLFNIFTGWLQNTGADRRDVEFHGSAAATPAHWQWQIDGLRELAALGDEINARFVLETHSNYIHDLPGPTAELIRQVDSPRLGALLDYANFLLWKNPPSLQDAVDTLSGRTFYVHLKNMIVPQGRQFIITGLGDGQINNRRLLREIFASGFEGPIGIEASRAGDGEWYAKQDISYLREILEALGRS